jgi:hypothetical protein
MKNLDQDSRALALESWAQDLLSVHENTIPLLFRYFRNRELFTAIYDT